MASIKKEEGRSPSYIPTKMRAEKKAALGNLQDLCGGA